LLQDGQLDQLTKIVHIKMNSVEFISRTTGHKVQQYIHLQI